MKIPNDVNKYAITNGVIKFAIKNDVIKFAITNDVFDKKVMFPNTASQLTPDLSCLLHENLRLIVSTSQ